MSLKIRADITIRPEQSADLPAIAEITRAAFADMPYSRQTETYVLAALRRDHLLALSLIAENHQGTVIGHIAASPVILSDDSTDWLGLGPLSVLPRFQGQGIGSALVIACLRALQERHAAGCILVGDPGFYHRFGFCRIASLTIAEVPQDYILALPLSGPTPQAEVKFPDAFKATA